MKCYDGSIPANISSLDLREYLMPTLSTGFISTVNCSFLECWIKKDSEAELSGKIAMLS